MIENRALDDEPYRNHVGLSHKKLTGVQVKLWDPCEHVPYLSALEVWSQQGAIQIHVYFYLILPTPGLFCLDIICTVWFKKS